MRRREFVSLFGGAVTGWPIAARAQQPAVPLIGFLSSRGREDSAAHTAGFLQGLKAFGYIDGQTARIEYRWATGDYGRLPILAKELVALQPAIMAVGGGAPPIRAAKAATSSIPIVFVTGDPVAEGLVASLARPGGNITGFSIMSNELSAKRLELILRVASQADVVGLLTNPLYPGAAASQARDDIGAAAKRLGLRLVVVGASTESELDAGFATLAKAEVKALVVQNDPFFDARRDQLAALTAKWRIPAIFHIREFPADGALMSYGANLVDAYRQMGIQAGRILRGANINDLPVMRPTQFQLVINLNTARALGLTVPPALLAEADEVIE
jgi:putative tryptophan/tyrosine transport system substrate-binding protein